MPGLISNTHAGFSSSEAEGRSAGLPKHRFPEEAGVATRRFPPALVHGSCKTTSLNIKLGIHQRLNITQTEMSHGRMIGRENVDQVVPNYVSSGSDHDPSSVCLFAMVNEFMENEGVSSQQESHLLSAYNTSKESLEGFGEIGQTLQRFALCMDSAEDALLRKVQLIMDPLFLKSWPKCDGCKATSVTPHGCLKRSVMTHLQKLGYNAAVCKTKWDHVCGIPAGDYEYIDVLLDGGVKPSERLIVDLDFQAQFVIARPTNEFSRIWQLLPQIYVGRLDRLKQIVHLMCEATKESLHVKGLHLPPWRKPAYMKSKWFSSYKRTSNPLRPCKEREYYNNNGLGFAIKGGALDARYTNELEMLYHDGANYGGKDVTPLQRDRRDEILHNDRGANYGGKEITPFGRDRDEIRVMTTDWQPPVVAPRPLKHSKVNGLTSLFKQVHGLQNEVLVHAV